MSTDSFWGNIFNQDKKDDITITKILKEIPLFAELKKSELKEIEKIFHKRKFKPNEVIFYEGEPGNGMYIVVEGKVGIYKNISKDQEVKLAELNIGDFFGELSLLETDDYRSASAICLEQTILYGFFRPDLLHVIERHPKLGLKIFKKLATMIGERLRATNREVQELKVKIMKFNISDNE